MTCWRLHTLIRDACNGVVNGTVGPEARGNRPWLCGLGLRQAAIFEPPSCVIKTLWLFITPQGPTRRRIRFCRVSHVRRTATSDCQPIQVHAHSAASDP
eukprot:1346051-Amphidinium_carterae.1